MPSNAADGDCLPRLNSPNLLQLGSSVTDKNAFLRSYIRSQEAYLASYALEGISAAAPLVDSATSKTNHVLRDFEIESGFGTPVLKYRTISRPVESPLKESKKPRKENTPEVRDKANNVGERPKERRLDRNQTATQLKDPSRSVDKNEAEARRNVTRGDPVIPQASKKRLRDPDSDVERLNRLAERRERRRAKKAIVAPKPKPPESDSEEESDTQRRRRTGKSSKKTKKSKGLNMPAGLALMHGFAATNIGKNRLTVQLDPVVGVFNKGKASAKTTVKKGKAAKPHLKLFSEERFLSKARGRPKGNEPDTDASTDDNHSHHSSGEDVQDSIMADDAVRERPGKKQSSLPQARRSKSKRSRSLSSATSGGSFELQRTRANDSPAVKRPRKRTREESPTWDIELEDGKLPSEASDTSVAPAAEDKAEGTVILDTHIAKARWLSAVQEKAPSRDEAVPMAVCPLEDHQSETSSIAPSHSASQTALRPGPLEISMFSKYFPAQAVFPPPQPIVANTTHEGLSSSPPASVRQPSPRFEGPLRPKSSEGVGISHDSGPPTVGSTVGYAPPDARFNIPLNAPQMVEGTRVSSVILDVSPGSPVLASSPLGFVSGPPSPALSGGVPVSDGLDLVTPTYSRYSASPGNARRHRRRRVRAGRQDAANRALDPDATYHHLDDLSHEDTSEQPALLGDDTPSLHFDDFAPAYPGSAPMYLSDFVAQSSNSGRILSAAVGDGTMGLEDDHYSGNSEGYLDHRLEEPTEYLNASYTPDQHVFENGFPGEDDLIADDGQLCYVDERWGPEESYGISYSHAEGLDEAHLAIPYDGLEEEDHVGFSHHHGAFAEDSGGVAGNDFGRDSDDFGCDSDYNPDTDVVTQLDMEEEEDPDCDFAQDDSESVLGSLQRFSQGRALLMGVSELGAGPGGGAGASSRAEEDVARALKGHWQRQRL